MTPSDITRNLMTRTRTPYYDAVARLWSYHEAGHAVMAHASGWPVVCVNLIHAQVIPPKIMNPMLARSRQQRLRCITDFRQCMGVLAAGLVAATIHQEAVDRQGYSSPQEQRAYSAWWQIRASVQLKLNFSSSHDPATDSWRLAKAAESIWVLDDDADVDIQSKSRVRAAEVLLAEKRAERILKQHWAAVCDVVTALHRSGSGVLKGKRVLGILARHFKTKAQVA